MKRFPTGLFVAAILSIFPVAGFITSPNMPTWLGLVALGSMFAVPIIVLVEAIRLAVDYGRNS